MKVNKLLEESLWGKPHDIGVDNDFLDMNTNAQVIKEKNRKWNYIKLQKLLCGKGSN
jgi:hypothetical protein